MKERLEKRALIRFNEQSHVDIFRDVNRIEMENSIDCSL